MVIAGSAAGVFLTEAVLRFFPRYKFENMVCMRTYSGDHHNWHKNHFRPSRVFGNELKPAADGAEYRKKESGVYRLLVLGDSVTQFGRWPEYLEEHLKDDGKYEVLNAGVAGWNLYNYYLYLGHSGLKLDPDLVLIGMCLNDIPGWNIVETVYMDGQKSCFYSLLDSRGRPDIETTLKINPVLFYRSYLYRFIISAFVQNKRAGIDSDPVQVLKKMEMLSGGHMAAIIFPFLKPLEKYDAQELDLYNQTLSKVREAGIEYLDITAAFNNYGEKELAAFRIAPEDKTHFSDEANRIKADIIYRWLKERML